jgi:hypothetical protein
MHIQMKMAIAFLVLMALSGMTANAETSSTTTTSAVLEEGREVRLALAETLSSKTASVGDPVALRLAEPLIVGGQVIAERGTMAKGIVATSDGSKFAGRAGKLNIRVESLNVNGTKVTLRGVKARAGDTKYGATIALWAGFGIVGLMKHGKQVSSRNCGTSAISCVMTVSRTRTMLPS